MGDRRMFWRAIVLAALLAAGVPLAQAARADDHATEYPGGTWSPPQPTYGVAAQKNVLVPMSDGVNLTVDIYYPANRTTGQREPGTFPVLLTQTPYNGSIGAANLVSTTGPGAYFVERGYIYVSADVRGTGRSVGDGGFFSRRDALDGAELVAWIVNELDGSNDSVGLHGCSYLGHTQLYTAAVLPDDLHDNVKAMVPACSGSDPYRTTYMVSGIPTPAWEGAGMFAGTLLGPTIEAYMVPKYLDSQAGGDTAYYKEFWRDRDHVDHAAAIAETGIATLLWNGWDDSGFGGLELYAALQNAHFNRDPFAPLTGDSEVTGRYQLILGDWRHGGGLDQALQLQWYETFVRGQATGLPTDTPTPLHVQEQVSGRWSNLAAYPFRSSTQKFSLVGDEANTLRWAPPETPGSSLVYDFPVDPDGATIAGPGALRVLARSSTTDLQLMADLYDVAPDGTAVLVSHGGVLGSMRELHPETERSWKDRRGNLVRPYLHLQGETPIAPGEVVELDIPLRPTLWRLMPGHHLRLRLVGQESTAFCFQKSTEITTDGVGCRARAAVQARLAGAQFTIDEAASFLNLPIRQQSYPAVPTRPFGTVTLPREW